jgi:hypothetical protein
MTSQLKRSGTTWMQTLFFAILATILTAVQVRGGMENQRRDTERTQESRRARDGGRWRFACPDYYVAIDSVQTSNGLDSVKDTVRSIPLSGPITNIPEYHDCQRFIDTAGNYDSVYAIFAAFRLEAGTLFRERAIPVATIYTPNGTYNALGIGPGFSCLFLRQVGPIRWTAMMVHRGQGNANSDCRRALPDGKLLEVKPQIVERFAEEDYPPVARWDWDSVSRQQYVGIRCGAAWCEVGAPGFTPSEGYRGPSLVFDAIPGVSLPPGAAQRVQKIKGWYDVQRLALPGVSPQRPDVVNGFLFPNPALDLINWHRYRSRAPMSHYTNRWVQVGIALLDRDYKKFHLLRGQNKILFCYGTASPRSCPMPGTPAPNYTGNPPSLNPVDGCPRDPSNPEMAWWSMTVSAAGDSTYGCIRRMDHLAQITAYKNSHPGLQFSIPSTARWKFLLDDEGTWHGCPTGCCTSPGTN